jgi:hypothetical protein
MSRSQTLILMSRNQDETFNMDTGLYTTPGWALSEKKLPDLAGTKVVLTTCSNERSYLGGTIVGFVPAEQTSSRKRYDVVFKAESKYIDNKITRAVSFNGNPVQYL